LVGIKVLRKELKCIFCLYLILCHYNKEPYEEVLGVRFKEKLSTNLAKSKDTRSLTLKANCISVTAHSG